MSAETHDDCVKKVQDLNNKLKVAETKAKEFAVNYLKKNSQLAKYRTAIENKLKSYFFENPLGMPVITVKPNGMICSVRVENFKAGVNNKPLKTK